jgi:thioredoxin:protein disulfide reductase
VMIDFYADWCLPCKELDARTFTDEGVIDESRRFVRLKADLTRPEAEETKRLTEQFEILGVPTIVFLAPSGEEVEGVRLVGFERPAPFLDRMQKVH